MINISRNKLIIIAIIIPIIVALLLEFNLFWEIETDNDWIGFYASYVGSIIGVFGVFEVMRIDQRKREEERKDALFLNILPLYRKIASTIHVEKLSKLKEKLNEIRSESNWDMVDSSTKNKLKQIEGKLGNSDECNGLLYTIRGFIESNLYEEFKILQRSPGDEFNEPIEYEGIPNTILDELTNIIFNNSNKELGSENFIVISVSKDELLEKFEEINYTKGYRDRMDDIYLKIIHINESKEWINYISNREAIFKQLSDLRTQINNRIERVLNY